MLVTQAYQKMCNYPINLTISSVVPVCGGCAAKPYISQQIAASFGCDDSREHGGINDDQFMMGIPYRMAEPLAKSLESLNDNGGK